MFTTPVIKVKIYIEDKKPVPGLFLKTRCYDENIVLYHEHITHFLSDILFLLNTRFALERFFKL